jgi:hypothetical protein
MVLKTGQDEMVRILNVLKRYMWDCLMIKLHFIFIVLTCKNCIWSFIKCSNAPIERCVKHQGCFVENGKCVNNCNYITDKYICSEEISCTWIHSKYTGEKGICLWKNNSNNYINHDDYNMTVNSNESYSCSDLKRYNECVDGGGIDILFNECEYYKGVCSRECYSCLNKEQCLREDNNDCLWMRNITNNSSSRKCIHKV